MTGQRDCQCAPYPYAIVRNGILTHVEYRHRASEGCLREAESVDRDAWHASATPHEVSQPARRADHWRDLTNGGQWLREAS